MKTCDYMLLWLAVVALAAVADQVWTRTIRPALAARYGWRELEPEEVIPAWAWIGALVVTTLFFIVVPLIGYAAGF